MSKCYIEEYLLTEVRWVMVCWAVEAQFPKVGDEAGHLSPVDALALAQNIQLEDTRVAIRTVSRETSSQWGLTSYTYTKWMQR